MSGDDDDNDFMDELPNLDDYDPEEVDVEVIDVFHIGGDEFVASVQLSDKQDEAGRSFLVRISLGGEVGVQELLRIEDLFLSHTTLGPAHHIALQVGATTHHMEESRVSCGEGPEPFTNKLWSHDAAHVFLFGDEGTVCQAHGTEWVPIPPATNAFLRTMDGPAPHLIHVAGDQGTLLRLAGGRWLPLDVGFDHSISAISVDPEGDVHFGCENGLCGIILRDERIEIVGPGTKIASICSFRGVRYWGDEENGLFVEEGNELVPFRALGVVYNMHASAERLAVSGWTNAFAFDGRDWSGIQFGFDGNLTWRLIDMSREFI
jgi:hypothetical protein